MNCVQYVRNTRWTVRRGAAVPRRKYREYDTVAMPAPETHSSDELNQRAQELLSKWRPLPAHRVYILEPPRTHTSTTKYT